MVLIPAIVVGMVHVLLLLRLRFTRRIERQYTHPREWYRTLIRVLLVFSFVECIGIPLDLAFANDKACGIEYILRFIIPAITSSLFLLAHFALVFLYEELEILSSLKEPLASSTRKQLIRQYACARKPLDNYTSHTLFMIFIVISPFVVLSALDISLTLPTCVQSPNFMTLLSIQLGNAFLWIIIGIYLKSKYCRIRNERAKHQCTSYKKTMAFISIFWLVQLIYFIIPNAILDSNNVDYLLLSSSHYVYFHYCTKASNPGKRTQSQTSLVGPANTPSITPNLNNLINFLSHADRFDHFLMYCQGINRIEELLAWKVIHLYQVKVIEFDNLYNECFGGHAVFATSIDHTLSSRILNLKQKKAFDTIDNLLNIYSDKLLGVMAAQILPQYIESSPIWDTFMQRWAISRQISEPRAILMPNPSSIALRGTSDLTQFLTEGSVSSKLSKQINEGREVEQTEAGNKQRLISINSATALIDTNTNLVPVLVVSSLYLIFPVRAIRRKEFPSYSTAEAITYHWYIKYMSLVCGISILQCVVTPIILALCLELPCFVGFLLRFIIPSMISVFFLSAHVSVLLVYGSVSLISTLRQPNVAPPLIIRQIRTLRSFQSRNVLIGLSFAAQGFFLIPYLFIPFAAVEAEIESCQLNAQYQSISVIQLAQIAMFLVVGGMIGWMYPKDESHFRRCYTNSMKSVLTVHIMLAIIVIIAYSIPWNGLWEYYVDYIVSGYLLFAFVYQYVHAHKRPLGCRIATAGPHVSSVLSVAATEFDSVNAADNLISFLNDSDHFDHFVQFCKSIQCVNELLTWRLLRLYKHDAVTATMVYEECITLGASLVTSQGLLLAPQVTRLLRLGKIAELDAVYENLSRHLIEQVAQNILPRYRRSAKTWDVFIQRSSIIKGYQSPKLAESPSLLALRASSDFESTGESRSSIRTSTKTLRLGDFVTHEALGLPVVEPEATKPPKVAKDRRTNTLLRQDTRDILREIQQECQLP